MADYLDEIAADQSRQDSRDVADAQHNKTWAETFSSTPAPEVLRSRVNYADAVNRAFDNKLALQARSDAKALDLVARTAQFKEHMAQAPLRQKILEARLDATGATERRKAEEARMTAEQTTNLNRGMLNLYQQGVKYGTPEFQQGVVGLIADNPLAHAGHIAEVGKMAGLGNDLSPDEYIAKSVDLKNKAIAAGLANPTIRSYGGKPTIVEGGTPALSSEQKIANDVAHKKAMQAVPPVGGIPLTAEQKAAKALHSVVNGALSFGILDEKGKLVPNTTDDKNAGQATHVQSFYQDPSGKMVRTPPMSIPEFQKLQGQLATPTPAPGAIPQAPAGEAAPNATAPVPIATGSSITTREEYDALPAGSEFVWNGKKGRKP